MYDSCINVFTIDTFNKQLLSYLLYVVKNPVGKPYTIE